MLKLPIFGHMAKYTIELDSLDKIVDVVMERNYDAITFISKNL